MSATDGRATPTKTAAPGWFVWTLTEVSSPPTFPNASETIILLLYFTRTTNIIPQHHDRYCTPHHRRKAITSRTPGVYTHTNCIYATLDLHNPPPQRTFTLVRSFVGVTHQGSTPAAPNLALYQVVDAQCFELLYKFTTSAICLSSTPTHPHHSSGNPRLVRFHLSFRRCTVEPVEYMWKRMVVSTVSVCSYDCSKFGALPTNPLRERKKNNQSIQRNFNRQ